MQQLEKEELFLQRRTLEINMIDECYVRIFSLSRTDHCYNTYRPDQSIRFTEIQFIELIASVRTRTAASYLKGLTKMNRETPNFEAYDRLDIIW